MSHQSYRDVIVSNNPALLTSGATDTLAVGQLGFFLYDVKKDQVAVTPNFSFHKVLQLIQGTPELPTNLLGAVANETKKSKPIKGKKILNFEGRRAERGQNQRVTLGFDGVDTTKTMTAKCEESKTIFIKLSGGPVDQIFHTEGKGYVRQYNIFSGCCDDCGDDCATVSAEKMADDLIKQVQNDPILGLGTRTGNKLLRVSKLTTATAPTPDGTCIEYLLSMCDSGDDTSLGLVQAEYPGSTVTRKSRTGSTSVYSIILDSEEDVPDDFSNEGLITISDCPVCPSGYTLTESGFVYKVERQDAGTAGALTTATTDYGVVAPETISRLLYEVGQSTYIIVSATEISAAVGTDNLQFVGESRNSCVITTPTEVEWTVGDTLNKFNKDYTITLNDNVCGTSRLVELQAAYPNLVVVETTHTDCMGKFTTTVLSNCVPPGCPVDAPAWVAPDAFQGISWTAVPPTYNTTDKVGVLFESAFVDRVTGECAFDFWSYDAEPLFIEISEHSYDYNGAPTVCATEWPVTTIQEVKIPIGVGSRVREEEAFFKGYDRKYRDPNPIVRAVQDSVLQADPDKYYDQYTISFEFQFHQAWFSEKETDSYRLEVYFQEGTGKQFETLMNAYIASAGIDISPVIL